MKEKRAWNICTMATNWIINAIARDAAQEPFPFEAYVVSTRFGAWTCIALKGHTILTSFSWRHAQKFYANHAIIAEFPFVVLIFIGRFKWKFHRLLSTSTSFYHILICGLEHTRTQWQNQHEPPHTLTAISSEWIKIRFSLARLCGEHNEISSNVEHKNITTLRL